jgi:hypothetical protein
MGFLGFGRGDNAVRPLTYTRVNLPGQQELSAAERTSTYQGVGTNLQAVFSDPAAQAYMRTMAQYGLNSSQGRAAREQLERRTEQLGARLPDRSRWAVGPNGTIGYQQLDVNNDIVYPLATVGAAAGLGAGALSAAGAFSGGAAAGGGAASAPAAVTVPASVGGSTAAAGGAGIGSAGMGGTLSFIPAGGGAGAAGGVGGAAGGIGAGGGGAAAAGGWGGTSAIGAYSSAGQTAAQLYFNHQAQRQQQEATDRAMALQERVLAQQQQNLSPYMRSGNAALERLNTLLTPQGQPVQGNEMVLVISPTGEQQQRPAYEAQHWQQRGATVMPMNGQPNSPTSAHGRRF